MCVVELILGRYNVFWVVVGVGVGVCVYVFVVRGMDKIVNDTL